MNREEELMQILLTNTIGESILIETLRSAAYFITRSGNDFKPKHHVTKALLEESRYCYFFVQSTGLDVLIRRFHLDYNPETLRNQFNYCVRHKDDKV